MTVDAPNRIDFATCGHDGHGNCAATTNALLAEGRQSMRSEIEQEGCQMLTNVH
jgi:hypothetical protein